MTEIMPVPRNLILLSYQQGGLGQDFPLPCFQRLPDLGLPRFPSGNVGILEMPGAALEYRRRKMSPLSMNKTSKTGQ